ncbi:arylesterase [Rubellimicrobium sp. CFH 75288]|uniref:arylesterase n=1 Tax=Rubellimicrobium sp. CFH 75288 TaxID=2697034 RepID=UPI001FB7F405|nr:arylesterase [Rubellimicrobium sp. CFH 75288]
MARLAFRNLALVIALAALPAAAQDAGQDAEEPVTVVALGDSLTAGYGLAAEEGLVPRLQAWLDSRDAGAVVLNAGVSGDTTAGGLARLDWALGEGADAVIVALGGNDYLRGIDPAVSRANLRAILEEVTGRGLPVLLVGIEASGQYGPDYRDAFNAAYRDLAEEFGALLVPDFFAPLRDGEGGFEDALRRYMQPDGIHPSAEGVERVVEETLGPAVLALVERTRPQD